jgi:microcystin-dependent protein
MADPFVAEIRIFPFNFSPRGWAVCDGQLLPLSQNTALFSLLGTLYGGNGKSNFALPDLQGRVPMHWGQGPGLSHYDVGQSGGSASVSLLESEIPSHSHVLSAANETATTNVPSAQLIARPLGRGNNLYGTGASALMNAATVAPTGGDAPHNNLMPYLTCRFNIALQGVFPPRT